MDIEKIKNILEVLKNTKISELNYEKGDKKIYLKKSRVVAGKENISPKESNKNTEEKQENKYLVIKSNYVGKLYLKNPETNKDYVKVGDKIKKGTILGLIEAMKIFKEIHSDREGEIKKILTGDNSPVEYNQELFHIG